MKKIPTIIFILSFAVTFAVFGNIAEASFASISSIQTTTNTNSVTITASINPNGSPTTVWVDYGTENSLANFEETNHTFVGTTGRPAIISIPIANLLSGTTYYFRMMANNTENTVSSNIFELQTNPSFNTSYNTVSARTQIVYQTIYRDETPQTETEVQEPQNTYTNDTQNTNTNNYTRNNQAANAFAANPLPNWLALIAVIGFITVLFTKLYLDIQAERQYVPKKESADHIDHLPI